MSQSYRRNPHVKNQSPKGSYVRKATTRPLLKGKALKEWMIDKGFLPRDPKKAMDEGSPKKEQGTKDGEKQ
jgi:hypothetical protein